MTESLYIHIPFCKSKCSYCDFFSVPGKSSSYIDEYVKALKNEILFRIRQFEIKQLKTVYIGGGTPSLLSFLQLKEITDVLKPFINDKTEISIESNPDDITEEKLSDYEKCSINRISVGLQAFSDSVLKNVGRRSDTEKNISVLSLLSDKWKGEVSADLICALPFQTEENFLKGLELLLSFNVSHISVYSLTFEEDTPLFKQYKANKIDYDFEKADKLWIKGRDFLEKNGFVHYEVSNFYKKSSGKPCLHNLTYWNLENYAGCGAGGTGSFYGKNEKNENNAFRYTNTKNIDSYISFWTSFDEENTGFKNHKSQEETEILSEDVLMFEFFMMGLRKKSGVSLNEFERRFGVKIPEKIMNEMKKWKENEKAVFYRLDDEDCFSLTEEGLLFLNQFLESVI